MGATVNWDEKNGKALAYFEEKVYRFGITTFGSIMIDNNHVNYRSGINIIINNRMLIPMEAVERALNCTVEWDKDNRNINIKLN